MFRSIRDMKRLLHAARVLARYDALVPREYADRAPFPFKIAQFFFGGPRKADLDVPPGVRLARGLESLGPAYIKLGQMLATRPDLIGNEIAGALECLQDRLPPFPEDVAKAAIERELGRPLDEMFAIFGEPVAAASIAQVHRAMRSPAASP
jgi:ubiquinone biosynthesis protein